VKKEHRKGKEIKQVYGLTKISTGREIYYVAATTLSGQVVLLMYRGNSLKMSRGSSTVPVHIFLTF
jgi:hypothetical protein